MDWRDEVRDTLGDVTGDAARDAEIVEELTEHLRLRYAERIAAGESPDDARRHVRAELHEHRALPSALRRADRRRVRPPVPPPTAGRPALWHDLTQDLRHGARLLASNLSFSVPAVLTLALGIGATTAIFTVVDAVLLRAVPLADERRLAMVWETDRNTGTTREPSSYPDYLDFRARSRQFADLAAFTGGDVTYEPNDGEPLRLAALAATSGFLPLLGVRPVAGRIFTADEDRPGGPFVVLISDRLWERHFQRRADAIGATIRLNERERTVIGVMPRDADFGTMQILTSAAYSRGFADRDASSRVDVWVPLRADPKSLPRTTHPIFTIGRLAPGATVSGAQQEMAAIMTDLERAYPENRARGAHVEAITTVVFGRVKPALWVLLSAVGFVLLIACVNVANLLLARGTTRLREVAVRTALGAPASRLARQFAAENFVLTLTAAAIGVALAYGGLRALIAMAPADIPRLTTVAIDARVVLVALGIAVLTGVVFGLVPVLQARRLDVQSALKSEDSRSTSGHGRSARSALVIAEVALAAVLTVGAGLLIKSFWQLNHVDAGFDAHGVVKSEFQIPGSRYPTTVRRRQFESELLRRVREIPGVESAALAGNHPLDAGSTNSWTVVGREDEARTWPEISIRQVTPGYFATVRLALRRGRLLTDTDGTDAPPVAVINEATARRFFEGREAIGQRIQFWGVERTIVGVAADERFQGLTLASPPAAYVALAQGRAFAGVLLVRTDGAPEAFIGPIRSAMKAVDPGLAVFGVEPFEETVAESIGQRRFIMVLLVVFASLALTLAAIGIHGVLSYSVAQRHREIGIRMALGAEGSRVTRLVVLQGMRLTAIGIVLGTLGALAVTRVLSNLLYGVSARDVPTLVAVLPVLAGVAALASYLPARRAVRIDPLAALRG